MPRTKSAKKALRQNARRRTQNVTRRTHIRDAVKLYKKAAGGKDTAEALAALSRAYQALDKMAKVGLIKKGKARRLKSRLAKKLPRG
ncbi:MAG: 30S ribosomal protein S20 [Candidatus Brennerbacteria bacterium]